MARGAKTGRARRWLRRIAQVLLVAVISAVCLVASAVVALQTPWGRERVRLLVNDSLADVFQGTIVLERIGGIHLWGVTGVDAQVLDPAGRKVIALSGLQAFASLPGLAYQLVANPDRPELFIALARVEHVEVTLRDDEDAGVTLANAFLPRDEVPTEEPIDPSVGTTFIIGRIAVEHAWAHGVAGGSPPLDADLSRLRGRLRQSPAAGFSLELESVQLVTRGLPLAVDPRAELSGRVEIPAEDDGPLRLELTGDGVVARSPFTLETSWVGDWLHASVTLAGLPAEFLNAQVSGLALDGDVTVVADVDGALPELAFDVEVDSTAAHIRAEGNAVLAEERQLLARVDLARVDASRVASDAPPTDLRAVISAVVFEEDDGELVGSHRALVDAGSVAGEATPAFSVNGSVRLDDDALELSGVLEAREPGATVRATYDVDLPAAGGGHVGAHLTAALDRPARLARLGIKTEGFAEVEGKLALATRTIDARASVSLARIDQGPVTARRVEAHARATGPLEAPRVSAAATLDLLSGRARADLEYSPQRQVLSVSAADIDMVQLSRLVGVKAPLKQGVLQLDATLTRGAAAAPLELDARGKADLGSVGSVSFEARDFEVPASPPNLASISNLRGDVAVRGKLDLAKLSPYLSAADVPLERASGKLRFELTAKHVEAQEGLALGVRLDSNALQIVGERQAPAEIEATAEAIDSQPFALEGIDFHLALHSALRDGLLVGTVILRDRGGTLAEVQGEASIAELWPSRLADVASLRHMPLRGLLRVPERRLGSLPPSLRPGGLRGRVSIDGSLSGSVADPRVEATISAKSLRAANSRDPVDVKALVTYAPQGGTLDVAASRTRASAEVARLTSEWRGDLQKIGELSTGRSGLSGSASLKLRDLPLEVAPQLADRQIQGRLSGDIELRDWGRDARVLAKLTSTTLVLGKFPVRELVVDAETGAGRARASAAIRVEAGTARAVLDAGATWGRKPLPELEHRGRLTLEARALQLESLAPLLGAYVSELGGILDASTALTVTPDRTELAGRAQLERGVVQLPSIGQRFSDISARVEVDNDELKLEALQARGITGRVTAKGRARLDGFALRSASLDVAIAENESIPLTIEGAALGDAWGNVQMKLAIPPEGPRRLEVDVPRFHLLTPENSGRALQSLDEPQDIRVGVRRADGKFVPLPVQPLDPGGADTDSNEPVVPLVIVVRLGRDVVVERGRTARAQLAGALEIESALETSITGRIEVRGGKLDVSGKTFEIERGVVTFDGRDPGNPTVTATARWDAPGYTVYAEYLGDIENGRIKLRSEPPLSEDEIASLLLFGSPDGSLGSGGSDNAALAISVAGDTAAKGINQVLDDFTNLDVSARVDTTTGSARPELVFQMTPRLTAKVTRAVGAPTANESPDRTFLTLELRLKRAWALSAVVGDRGGSALDLIWRKRY